MLRKLICGLITLLFITPLLLIPKIHAQSTDNGFSLQVTPSPLFVTVKPGVTQQVELRIRNAGLQPEKLTMNLRRFTINHDSGDIQLTNEVPSEVKDWISFSSPTFSIDPGAWFTQEIVIKTPSTAGFSYGFALVINRTKETPPTTAAAKLKGAIAIFTLLSVDRPGATKTMNIVDFSSKRRLYEYLPAEFSIKLKNSGNTIIQPYGNIYIQRKFNSATPLAVLPLNTSGAYFLPDSSRTISSQWTDGFPVFQPVKAADNLATKSELKWDWSQAQKLRFGRYTARLIAVYNDGQRDVPIEATLTFWVVPWKLMSLIGFVLLLIAIGLFTITRKSLKIVKSRKRKVTHAAD